MKISSTAAAKATQTTSRPKKSVRGLASEVSGTLGSGEPATSKFGDTVTRAQYVL